MKWAKIVTIFFLFSHYSSAATLDSPTAMQLGRFHSRAIWTGLSSDSSTKAPVVVLVPGSGPMGPQELIPGKATVDGKEAPLFDQMAVALNSAGVQTLQLGKPGIENLSKYDPTSILTGLFYDQGLYTGLHWADLLSNLGDAVTWLSTQPKVDATKIYILGHSEGTQVAVDYAAKNSTVAGVILLGYTGEDISKIVDWQLFRREIDDFIATDVDANHDGFVTRDEAAKWSEFQWNWKDGQTQVSYSEIEAKWRADPDLIAVYNKMKNFPLYSGGIWNRGPIYAETAALTQPVYVFNGALDEQTPPEESLQLAQKCIAVGKKNCSVTLIPGVGHGFSPPKPPRAHPFLDMTVGPVEPAFLSQLSNFAKTL